MPMAKGLTSGYVPLSAVAVGDGVAEVLSSPEAGEFAHGYTYSGHPVACAVALANIRLLESEGLIERTREDTGPYFQARLQELTQLPLVGEVRGVGLIAGIQLTPEKARRAPFEEPGKAGALCRDRCFANDVICRSVGDSMVLSPPLTITRAEIEELVKRLRRSIEETTRGR